MDVNMDMSMPATFTSSTTVTLFFSAWTTTSIPAYIFTLLFLFALAFFNRFLAALRFQLESHPSTFSVSILPAPRPRRRTIPKARLSPLPRYTAINDAEEHFQIPEEHSGLVSENKPQSHTCRRIQNYFLERLPQWTPSSPWSWRDGGLALLEGARAFIGYILMLAVMTFNTGVFFAVIVGIVAGETVLGRYMRQSGISHDGACHDG
ncbi:hypothetical protein ASPVEDRAFT_88813 [Aspergillus versicolor CBS 583.65]|uniref:Copper transport protein n=1 Tax=Aspergillus versicolor CBS 583.65 TaxID=1036611 RepID=A0A1L9Q1D2_ASPVE|nr:uncharacterized protein ASPVEDRAFT_88813 [Aspergillus versicolor CBS 583.65]OJJ07573.1 hypothetical protein ASPVEDRAFT_88813 [Aspergillus versicolor CBS 583.65]